MSEIVARDSQPPMMALIERLAMDPNVGVDKVERLVALHERMLAFNAKQAFAAAFVAMKPNLPRIARTKHNAQTGSFYAPLEDISAVVDPIIHSYGFATTEKVVAQTDRDVTVRCELWHAEGHVEFTDVTIPIDATGIGGKVNKTGPHATASSITYGKRYAKCAVLDIATSDDHDGNLPPRGQSQFDRTKSAERPQIAVGPKAGSAPRERAVPAHSTGPDRATILKAAGWAKTREGVAPLEDWWNALPQADQQLILADKGLLRQWHTDACLIEDDRRAEEDHSAEDAAAEREVGYDASWNAHSDRESMR